MDYCLAAFSSYVSILCGCIIVMSDDVIIKVEGLWKRYGLPLVPAVRGLVTRLRNSKSSTLNERGPWALRDVSFEVKQGETLGIIGRNGAGKSTLLKILAGVTPPTRGQIAVRGRVFPMIELNAGIHPELTGRENVRLLGAIMGLSRQEIEAKIPEIGEFTELGEWFNQPVRKYSSGMLARLGFGVAMNADADILLIDEVLAVGDLEFQTKCHRLIGEMRENNVTTLFVSHNLNAIRNLCNKAIVLWNGEVAAIGEKNQVVDWYVEHINERKASEDHYSAGNITTCDARLDSVEILNLKGKKSDVFTVGEGMIIRVAISAMRRIEAPCVYVGLRHAQDALAVSAGFQNSEDGIHPVFEKGTNVFDLRIDHLHLRGGKYFVNISVHKSDRFTIIARRRQIDSFKIESMIRTDGIAYLPHTWEFSITVNMTNKHMKANKKN